MPIYEYKCRKCSAKFDILKDIGATNEGITCPKCGAKKPVKQFSVFSSSGGADNSECASGVCPTCNIPPN